MNRIPLFFAAAFLLLGLAGISTADDRYGGAFAEGVSHFYAGNYAEAHKAFELAEIDRPGNHAAYLWHGLTFTAMGDINRASDIWLKMPYDVKHKATFRYFEGLAYWRAGETAQAKYWFQSNGDYKETPAYALCQAALKSLLNDQEAPPISEWATIAQLPGAKGVASNKTGSQPAQGQPPQQQQQQAQATQPNTSASSAQAQFAGAKPSGGLWRGTISNGYKGQTIGFRVSPDGTTISDVVFQGYLIRRGGGIEDTQLAPLRDVPVNGGSFEDTQLNGGAMVRFDFTGRFTSATTAEGTYRVMSDTDCDTYKLNWTASRVGE